MTTPATSWTPIQGVDYGAAVAGRRRKYELVHPAAHVNPGPDSWMTTAAGWSEYLHLFAGDARKNYVSEGKQIAGVADTIGTTTSHIASLVTFLGRPLGQIMIVILIALVVWHWWGT